MKKRKAPFVIIVFALALCSALVLPDLLRPDERSYALFKEELEAGKLEKVTFDGNYLIVTNTEGEKYSTVNPENPYLKEELLLRGVKVNAEELSLESATNTLFNLFFLALIGFGLYKLFSWYRKTFKVVKHTGMDFSRIAGMKSLKRDMLYAVQILKGEKTLPGNRPLKGIILEGPPGNGKTLFARALAEESKVSFIATKGADFQGALMGLGAMKVKMLFNKARKQKPCIIFIDEFDSIGEKRNYAGTGIDKENNRILTTLLNEMDGFEGQRGILVIAATNSFTSLDPALIRPGRFDLKYTISNPDTETRKELVHLYTKGKSLSKELTIDLLADITLSLSSAAIENLLNEAFTIQSQSGEKELTLSALQAAAVKCQEKLNFKRR